MSEPVKTGKTFFFANYEGSVQKAIFGGARATVPTEAMRNGDFRGLVDAQGWQLMLKDRSQPERRRGSAVAVLRERRNAGCAKAAEGFARSRVYY